MPETLFPPNIKSGYPSADGTGKGSVVLSQSARITQNSTNAVSVVFYVPQAYPDAVVRILDIIFDVETAFNSATSATGTVGTAAAGTQYAGSIDAKVAGRARPTFTGAQLTAMRAVSSGEVWFTITPSGATSAGVVTCTLVYTMA